MTNLLSSHLEDRSTPQYFCFSIRCEVCGEFWYSSSIPFSKALQAAEHREKKELYDAIYQREKQRAMQAAGQEARERFSQCPICRRLVCDACFPLAKEYGFTYLGGHPMAGTHNSGFKYATPTMFHNAPMVLVPADHNDIDLLSRVKKLLAPAGFGRFSITTAEQHDEMIAFTSQLAHVVSNAYIKSPTAGLHKGFSAGSYKDMTRVAWLAPEMWAELFLENKDFLMAELDTLMANLRQYQDAMVHNDLPGLVRLLDEGRKRKEEVDGR